MASEAKPKARTATATEYVVLRQMGTATPSGSPPVAPSAWSEVGTATAVTAQAAIKAAADGQEEGTFVAVPARSWKPLTRKVETVKKDVWT